MRILLLNDNPVVRKLVALSAQKTKDDLNVIWSVDEIEHDKYDLLIVDDAYYSDEIMAALGERITYKTSLLMATRGNAVPAGFDKVINKPFLPTDLVELFANIEKSLPIMTEKEEEKSIDLPKIELDAMADEIDDELFGLDDEIDFSEDKSEDLVDLEAFEDLEDDDLLGEMKTNILDHEEVQELQDLLDDSDELEDETELKVEALTFDDEDEFDDLLNGLGMDEGEEELKLDDEELDEALLDDLILDEMEVPESTQTPENLEELLPMDQEDDLEELTSDLLSDDEFDDLEQQIQDAVGELDLEDLNSTLEDVGLEEFGLDELSSFDGLDDLDGLDEREIKLAIGESVEEELSVRVGSGEHSSLDAEALSEAMGKSSIMATEVQSAPSTPVAEKSGFI